MSMLSFSAGGINVADIVGGLMDAERIPLQRLEARKGDVRLQVTATKTIATGLSQLRTEALSLIGASFTRFSASSSSNAASVSLGAAPTTGSISFTVDQVASTHGLRTAGTVASSASQITEAGVLAISSGTGRLGIGGVRAGAGLTAGARQVEVVAATTGARRTSDAALAANTTITSGANDQLSLEVNGVARTVTIAPGSYDRAGLAEAVSTALGEDVSATLDHTGRMVLTTAAEGSEATLRITGGSALGALGLSVDTDAVTGGDGTLRIGDTTVSVTSAGTGEVLTVDTGEGELDLTLTGGLRTGTARVGVVSTGDGSLASVASAINAANAGVSAAAVKIADGAWTLQLSSSAIGSTGRIALDGDAFAGLGGLVETSAAQDAQITIGSGAGAYSVTGQGNTFANLLGGATVTVSSVSATPVTVGVQRNDGATADAVEKLVERANTLLAQIANQTRFDPDTNASGPLNGQMAVRMLADDVRRAVTSMVPGYGNGLASEIGLSTNREGRITFDRATFLAAVADNPDGVARMFGQGGTATEGLTFTKASNATAPGTYAVEITTAATRATSEVLFDGGVAADTEFSLRVGTTVVSHTIGAGASAAEIAEGIQGALTGAGLTHVVEVEGTGVRITAASVGSSQSFEHTTGDPLDDATVWTGVTGTDVAGTIDGRVAAGVGDRLYLFDSADSGARGLEIRVEEGVVGPGGSVTYEPGIAARLVALDNRMTGAQGALTLTEQRFENRIKAFNTQIDRFEERMERLEARLIRQWASIQTMLQSLQGQQEWLGNQINAMQGMRPPR